MKGCRPMLESTRAARARTLVAVCGLAVGVLLLAHAAAHAFSCRPQLIPNGSLNGCSNCHQSEAGGGPRNAFGEDAERFSAGCEPFWEVELAELDSDEDGRTNGEELGDPSGDWQPGDADPGDPGSVTNPGIPDDFPPPVVSFVRGDSNADGKIDISDAVRILGFLFSGDAAPTCLEAAEVNGDGRRDITDAVYLLLFLFSGGKAPPAPFPACGEALEGVECESFAPCA